MTDRTGAVTFDGQPLTLAGNVVGVDDDAPDFTAVTPDLEDAKLSDFEGKTVVLVTVPSLDTSVCDAEARRFNKEATSLGDDVAVVTVSMDLPFAQKRWCGQVEADNLSVLSDHRDASVGENYGVLIKELRLLARTIFIIDKSRKIRYVQLVEEMTHEPDYDAVLSMVEKVRSQAG